MAVPVTPHERYATRLDQARVTPPRVPTMTSAPSSRKEMASIRSAGTGNDVTARPSESDHTRTMLEAAAA